MRRAHARSAVRPLLRCADKAQRALGPCQSVAKHAMKKAYGDGGGRDEGEWLA